MKKLLDNLNIALVLILVVITLAILYGVPLLLKLSIFKSIFNL